MHIGNGNENFKIRGMAWKSKRIKHWNIIRKKYDLRRARYCQFYNWISTKLNWIKSENYSRNENTSIDKYLKIIKIYSFYI